MRVPQPYTLGAADGNRTRTMSPSRDFKSLASTCSATAAYWWFRTDSNCGQFGYEPKVLTN